MRINKNIPIPAKSAVGRPAKYPFKNMEVGESIFFEGKKPGDNEYTAAILYGRYHNMKFSGRKYELDGVEGLMIWRIA